VPLDEKDSPMKSGKLSILDVALSLDAPPHPFPSLGFFHPPPFPGLEIHGMLLDLLDDRFLLYASLEPAECGFQIFAFFKNDKRQERSPPISENT
jgi:hypothetical protein